MSTLCLICKTPMKSSSRGSERRFCSTACKSAARNERSRVLRAMEGYEQRARELEDEVRAPCQLNDILGRSAADLLANSRRNIDELTARLRVLHGADDEDGSTD